MNDPSPAAARAGAVTGLRFAFGTLTVLPVRLTRWDRAAARAGMLCAPVAGLVVGLAAAGAGGALWAAGAGAGIAAVASVAVPAVLTRGLHLDGLADTADGLGSAKPPAEALRIMKRSDIGPFGVITLLFVLLAQIAAVARLYGHGWEYGAGGTVLAAVTARLALTAASRAGVPSARPEGLGAAVAGAVPGRLAAAAIVLALALCAAAGGAVGAGGAGPEDAVRYAVAALGGLAAAELLLRHCGRRFGGVTGDVFGALAETATTATLLLLALTA